MTTLGDVALSIRNGLFAKRPTDEPLGTPVLRISAVRDGRVAMADRKYVAGLTSDEVAKFRLVEDDLLITRYNGSRRLVGICARVGRHAGPVIHPDKLIRVSVDRECAEPQFVNLQMQSPGVRTFLEPRIRTTAGQSGISGRDVRAVPLWLPSLPEQQRIVDVLEDHLSRLDAAEAALRTASLRLGSLMQSALSTAYRHGDLRDLGSIASIQGGIQKQPKRAPASNAYPFLRVANVTKHGLDLAEVHQVELFGSELERLRLEPGDLLVVEGNGSASQIGRAAVWTGVIENCVHQNHLIRVRPAPGLHPDFLEAVWNSPQNRAVLSEVASSTSGLHTLSVAKLKQLRIPLPAWDSQVATVEAVTALRTSRKRLDDQLAQARQRAAALRRSLLAAAFSGRL